MQPRKAAPVAATLTPPSDEVIERVAGLVYRMYPPKPHVRRVLFNPDRHGAPKDAPCDSCSLRQTCADGLACEQWVVWAHKRKMPHGVRKPSREIFTRVYG